ncbi:SpoIIAA-like protein [Litoreibacter halocynthiae]|uniref:SpoIIAA-like protein n=1 Tax=Litoreibacter halocynthiae TaxID=1242689 RepID=A0A4V3EWK8_9RHOB|nr:STAS/SEC14 domain-containing protein [Litoreibacter halocynthiae]TDT77265.1 SpoIIAA-like protein [Litoreibacter halocynthiae]
MFTVETLAPDLLKIEIGGKITAEEMSSGLDTLLPLTSAMADGRMLALYHDIEFPEAGAILEEMKRLPQLFAVIGKVKKVALVSDQKWIRDMAMLEGKIIPGMTIRSFEFKDRAQAEAYLDMADTSASDDDDTENFPV